MIKLKKLRRDDSLGPLESVLFLDFIKGLTITMKNLLRKPITTQYPKEKITPPKRFRGKHGHFVYDGQEPPSLKAIEGFMSFEKGKSRCVACYMCQTACPMPTLFRIEAIQMPDGKKKVVRFDMNLLNCLFCGLCVDACPVECLTMSDIHEMAVYRRAQAVIHMDDMEKIGATNATVVRNLPDRIWRDDKERETLWGKVKWNF